MLREADSSIVWRWLSFGAWTLLTAALFVRPLAKLVYLSLTDSDYSHLIIIPFFAAVLLYIERRSILGSPSSDRVLGSLLALLGTAMALAIALTGRNRGPDLQLTGYILALVLIWAAGFAFFFGRTSIKAACFPLFFLLLMVPPPDFLLDRVIYLLQAGSADITGALFDLVGVPALREGFVFHLARMNIEIAKECSGIRSSIALVILALPVMHFGFRRLWKKALFLACALLMMLVKNGIRIVTLTLLAIHVDPGFLYGRLHREGGILFFLLGLLLLLPIYVLLRDRDPSDRQEGPTLSLPG